MLGLFPESCRGIERGFWPVGAVCSPTVEANWLYEQSAPTMSWTRKKRTNMQVQVEYRTNHLGVKMPVRFRFDGREVEIVEIVDQWYGPDYCYFKIKGNDGNLYILRFDEGRVGWELTMFQNLGAASPSCQRPR
jgi:hypothetical protein